MTGISRTQEMVQGRGLLGPPSQYNQFQPPVDLLSPTQPSLSRAPRLRLAALTGLRRAKMRSTGPSAWAMAPTGPPNGSTRGSGFGRGFSRGFGRGFCAGNRFPGSRLPNRAADTGTPTNQQDQHTDSSGHNKIHSEADLDDFVDHTAVGIQEYLDCH